jgi:hypothetical protein
MLEAELGGVIPRAIDQLFASLAKDAQSGSQGALQLSISYLEIYNECIRDLLTPADGAPALSNSGTSACYFVQALKMFKMQLTISWFHSLHQSVEFEFSVRAVVAFNFLAAFNFLICWTSSGINLLFQI